MKNLVFESEQNKALAWQESLATLKHFVAEHPEIICDQRSLSVPPELRDEFYDQVQQVQFGITTYCVGDRFAEIQKIASLCIEMREKLLCASGLEELKFASTLENFLANPLATLAKPSFDIVLEAIQNDRSTSVVEEKAREKIPVFCEMVFRNAYEAWAYYGIVRALKPRKFYAVLSPNTIDVHAVESPSITIGSQITSPERRIPEAVFETENGSVFAMKSEVARELDFYGTKITRRRDFSAGGNTVDQNGHRVLLLYKLESLDKINLIADRDEHYVRTSDLMCEFLCAEEMEQISYAASFFNRAGVLRSKHPIQVLVLDDDAQFPQVVLEDKDLPTFERKVIGYEENELVNIASLLMNE